MPDARAFVLRIADVSGTLLQSTVPRPAIAGHFVKSYDPDAHDGRGDLVGTLRLEEALRFPTAAAAFEFYRQQSKVRPLREDGRPNRPATAFSIELVPLEG